MAHRVYLHIGAPKTGTTYLQALFVKNRELLAAHGVLYPESKNEAHHMAVWDLQGNPSQRRSGKGIKGSWQRLVDRVNASDSDVLVSSEHFVFAADPHVEKALTSFDGEVHVIYTARDLVRQVPAVWQERIKNQRDMTYRSFIESVMSKRGRTSAAFWAAQDARGALARWSRGLAPGRLHLVTIPPAGRPHRVLWDRCVSVLGLDGKAFDLELDGSANESLTMMQTELLRRYNERHAQGIGWPQYRKTMRRQLTVLSAAHDDRKIRLTPHEYSFFASEAAAITEAVARTGYDVVGDLADLIPPAQDRASRKTALDPTELSDSELLEAALDVMHRLLTQSVEEKRAVRRAQRKLQPRSGTPNPTPSADA